VLLIFQVQPLIDAVCDYLPDPTERERIAYSKNADGTENTLKLLPDPKLPLVAYDFIFSFVFDDSIFI
jgi:translation elongation factor EF-G